MESSGQMRHYVEFALGAAENMVFLDSDLEVRTRARPLLLRLFLTSRLQSFMEMQLWLHVSFIVVGGHWCSGSETVTLILLFLDNGSHFFKAICPH